VGHIIAVRTDDVRFPTSAMLDGSDAMNPDPDYSAAYVRIATDDSRLPTGHAFVFTIGRGNDVQTAAIASLESYLVGLDLDDTLNDLGGVWKRLVHDSQLRWLGPEKGVMHMAIGAVVNALWDLRCKRDVLPLWRVLAGMSPSELVSLVDFRYLRDVLTEDEASEMLARKVPERVGRIADVQANGYPAYTSTPGWLGYDDDKLSRLCKQAVADGFELIKLKVGANLDDDVRRFEIARRAVGPEIRIAIDANQRWEVDEAVAWVNRLAEFDIAWVEEPTNPDDILAHAAIAKAIAPIPVATGEHMANRVMAKQFLQARGLEVLQLDATRVAGINENIAMLLLAAKFGVRVCPHAGGVGLCEIVQHLSMFDFVAITGSREGRMIEYVDHLHEHFVTPAQIENGRYVAPDAPGTGAEMIAASIEKYRHAP
jgi:L-fuconate dehydratase